MNSSYYYFCFIAFSVEDFQENSDLYYWQRYQEDGYSNNQGQQYEDYKQQNADQGRANRQQQYDNGGGQQQLYIGPSCSGGRNLQLGLFCNERCTYPVEEGVTVKDILGYTPSSFLGLGQCTPCSSSWYGDYYDYNTNNNDEQLQNEIEIYPICERLLEGSGRCDRDESQETDFDLFWKDLVSFVNGGGSFQEDDGYNAEYYYERGDAQEQNNKENLQNNAYNMDYSQYQNQNTCDFIDSLRYSKPVGSWEDVKKNFSKSGSGMGALISIVFFAAVAVAIVVVIILR